MRAAYMEKQANIPMKLRRAFYSLFSMTVLTPHIVMKSQ